MSLMSRNLLKFLKGPGSGVIIRDVAGCLQARGQVVDLSTVLKNVNGQEMLTITKSGRTTDGNV